MYKNFFSEFSFYFSYTKMNFRHDFLAHSILDKARAYKAEAKVV